MEILNAISLVIIITLMSLMLVSVSKNGISKDHFVQEKKFEMLEG